MISLHVSYRYLLIIVLVAALLCLMPARGADAPNEKKPQTAAAQSVESAEAPAGADLSAEQGDVSAPHAVLRALRPQRSAAGKTARTACRADARRAGKGNRRAV